MLRTKEWSALRTTDGQTLGFPLLTWRQGFSRYSQQLPQHTDLKFPIKLLTDVKPNQWCLGSNSHLLKAVVLGPSAKKWTILCTTMEAIQSVNYRADFTKGMFLFSFYLKVSTGQWTLDENWLSYDQLLCLALWSTFLRLKMQVQQWAYNIWPLLDFLIYFISFSAAKLNWVYRWIPVSCRGKSLYTMRLILVFPHGQFQPLLYYFYNL